MKLTVTIISKDLLTNSLFSSVFFLTNPKQESGFQQVGGLVRRNICFLFIASRALL